jgi:hypothetical protein
MARTGGPVSWPAQSPGLNPLDSFSAGTPKDFGVFSADYWLRNIGATSRKCLSGDLSETRNFQQNEHPSVMKSWKLCWNAWEPHRAPAVEIRRTSPISQLALVSGHMLFAHLSENYILLKPLTLFLTPYRKPYEIWGFGGSDYEECSLLGCDAVYHILSHRTSALPLLTSTPLFQCSPC